MTRVLLFGSFDGLHAGHIYLIDKAKDYGDTLIVALANDEFIKKTKGVDPLFSWENRKNKILENFPQINVVPCDDNPDSWNILKTSHPDIIVVGYDQTEMKKSLEKEIDQKGYPIKIIQIDALSPEIYKSSIINKKNI